MATETSDINTLELATELTIAWLSNPNTRVAAEEVPGFLARMNDAVKQMAAPQQAEVASEQGEAAPAVSVRKSLASKDHILSLIDGKPYKTLRRHLSRHGMTPEQYRERFGLKADYPMVSEAYSQVRRAMAQKIGLGRKGRGSAEQGAEPAAATAKAAPARAKSRKKDLVE